MAEVAKILSNLRKDEGKAEKACQIKLEQPLCIESNLQWTILSRRDKVQQCTRLRRRMEKQKLTQGRKEVRPGNHNSVEVD